MDSASRLLRDLEKRDWRARIVPVRYLAELRAAVDGAHERGLLDETLYRVYFSGFDYELPADLPGARSIIVVAVPAPCHRMTFHWRGRGQPLDIPPTYVHYTATGDAVRERIAALLSPEGHRVRKAALPLKTLAVRSGLAEYGRNNICFVPGMGSFLQLAACFSDLPCPGDPWREPRLMARCESCATCMARCPTGAITKERVLLRAERCLTYHNEQNVAIPFPAWIEPAAHNALIGCMLCQRCCPENREVLDRIVDLGEFSEAETIQIMDRSRAGSLPDGIKTKLRKMGLNEEQALPRNLAALLDRESV